MGADGELERLRELTGPDPEAYARLRRDRDDALAHAREMEQEAGRLRARVARLERELRARRAVRGAAVRAVRRAGDIARRWRP